MAPSTLNDDSSVSSEIARERDHRRGGAGASGDPRAARCREIRRFPRPASAFARRYRSSARDRLRESSIKVRSRYAISRPRRFSLSRGHFAHSSLEPPINSANQPKRVRARNRGRNRRDTTSKSRVSVVFSSDTPRFNPLASPSPRRSEGEGEEGCGDPLPRYAHRLAGI